MKKALAIAAAALVALAAGCGAGDSDALSRRLTKQAQSKIMIAGAMVDSDSGWWDTKSPEMALFTHTKGRVQHQLQIYDLHNWGWRFDQAANLKTNLEFGELRTQLSARRRTLEPHSGGPKILMAVSVSDDSGQPCPPTTEIDVEVVPLDDGTARVSYVASFAAPDAPAAQGAFIISQKSGGYVRWGSRRSGNPVPPPPPSAGPPASDTETPHHGHAPR